MKTLTSMLLESIRGNWEELALTDFNGVSYQYRDIARKVSKLHLLFEQAGVRHGDKIAICGRNSSQWAVAFFAALTYGAVAVPILHEFKPDNIHHLVCHSDASLFFVDETIWENLDPASMTRLEGVIRLSDFSLLMSRNEKLTKARAHLNELFGKRYPERFSPEDLKFTERNPDDVALINYTSGSTGFSKGVMLSYRSLTSNVHYCLDHIDFLKRSDSMVCMLPLAHMYGLSIELLFPIMRGCHIFFLTRVPSPKIILDAFAKVKPILVVSVPLIIEKIVKTRIFPMLEKPVMKFLMKMPFVDERIERKFRDGLLQAFGGNVHEVIIGGAGLNKDVEAFLRKIKFPYTVGYGMTECGPLISYAPWHDNRAASCGRIVDRMKGRVESPDPVRIPGELWVKGDNLMNGYYKNAEATKNVMKDGWMNTGDLCTMDDDGFIYIRGRNKNMILGPSGQNIYPEEIEQAINNLPYVGESLVVDNNGKLVALIYPDLDTATREGKSLSQLLPDITANVKELNRTLPAYSQITNVKLMSQEFEKTPKRSIKRYLYLNPQN